MGPQRKCYGNETWSQWKFMNMINLNRTGKKRMKRVRRAPQMSGNKIMKAVMLGHMLGKTTKMQFKKMQYWTQLAVPRLLGWEEFGRISCHPTTPSPETN